MNKKEYIMVGTNTISKDKFRNILRPLDNQTFKPTGGLWTSDYYPYMISSWFDYLRNNPDLLYYKSIHKASMFTLKDTANILLIDNERRIQDIVNMYPSYSHLLNNNYVSEKSINYEALSKDYDGMYLDYSKVSIYHPSPIFRAWSVNTLLLFNLDVIDDYQGITIDFHSPKNYDYPYFKEVTDKKIEEESIYHKELYTYIETTFNELIAKKEIFIDYDEYFSFLVKCIKASIQLTLKNKIELASIIKAKLQEQNLTSTEYSIIRNIATNVLSNFFKNNTEKEKNIPKTKIKKLSEYPIDEN